MKFQYSNLNTLKCASIIEAYNMQSEHLPCWNSILLSFTKKGISCLCPFTVLGVLYSSFHFLFPYTYNSRTYNSELCQYNQSTHCVL